MKYDEERQRIRENLKNENKKYQIDENNITLGILICIVGILVIAYAVNEAIFWGDVSIEVVVAVAFLLIAIAVGLLLIYIECSKKSDLNKAVEAEISKLEKKEQEHQRQNQLGITGQWEFPAEEFYCRCVKNKAKNINTEYGFNKAKMIAEQLIQEECPDADLDCFAGYMSKKKLQEFFDAGKPLAERTAKEELARKKGVHPANADTDEKMFIERAAAVAKLYGNKKRIQMLTDLVNDCDKRIEALKAGEKAIRELGMVYMGMQKKEKDWSILAGAASGIGGPVAGFATAANIMQDNNQIRKYNEDMRQASQDVLKGTISMATDRYKVEETKEQAMKKLSEAKTKVTLSKPLNREIWENIYVDRGKASVSKSKSGVLKCTLPISLRQPFNLDVPKDLNMVVDGTVRADVMMEEIYVGYVEFPLPIYGIPYKMTNEVVLDGMCAMSMEYDGRFSLRIDDDQNLWIMEA